MSFLCVFVMPYFGCSVCGHSQSTLLLVSRLMSWQVASDVPTPSVSPSEPVRSRDPALSVPFAWPTWWPTEYDSVLELCQFRSTVLNNKSFYTCLTHLFKQKNICCVMHHTMFFQEKHHLRCGDFSLALHLHGESMSPGVR